MSSLHPPQQQAESRVERPNSRTPWTVRDETDGASAPQQPNSSYQPRLQRSHRHLPKFRQHKGEVPTKEMGPEGSPAPRLKECAFVALRGGELTSPAGKFTMRRDEIGADRLLAVVPAQYHSRLRTHASTCLLSGFGSECSGPLVTFDLEILF